MSSTTNNIQTCFARVGCGNGSSGTRCNKPVFTGKCLFKDKGKCAEHIAESQARAERLEGFKRDLAVFAPALDKAITSSSPAS